jgi:hypothetical protein
MDPSISKWMMLDGHPFTPIIYGKYSALRPPFKLSSCLNMDFQTLSSPLRVSLEGYEKPATVKIYSGWKFHNKAKKGRYYGNLYSKRLILSSSVPLS